MDIVKQKAIKEVERRKASLVVIRRGDYRGFLLYQATIFKYHYKKNIRKTWFDELLARAFMDVFWGIIDRLILEMPPRHGKTERGVRMFTSYAQGLENYIKFQYGTYGGSLSELISGETKDIMESTIYREIFPNVDFSNKLNLKHHWKLIGGGGFLGTSVQGGATGIGSEIAINDDLLKAMEASSKAARDAAWNFYDTSTLSRLEGRKAVIFIMQRLHEDDPVGRAIKRDKLKKDGGAWDRITLPIVNDFETFEEFYKWIKTLECRCDYVGMDECGYCKVATQSNTKFKACCDEYDKNHQIITYLDEAEREKYLIKQKNKIYYEVAREVYLDKYPLPNTIIKYRDYEVVRPPLTTLDSEEFGLDFVVKQMSSMSLAEFKRQYFQDAEVSEAGHFKEDDFTYVTDADLPDMYEYILVDNAESEEASADDRGIVAVGKCENIDKTIRTIVLDGRRGKWDVYGTCENIIHLMLKFPKAPVLIEGAGAGITLGKVLAKEIMIYNTKAQIEGRRQITNSVTVYKPNNQISKNANIKLMTAPLEHHLLQFYKFADQFFMGQLKKEFLKFNPEIKHNTDNCIDPLSKSFLLAECSPKPYKKPEVKQIEKFRKKYKSKTSSWKGI
ncbi:MAG: hypothetical protein PHI79_04595 [Sulfurovaceae bacterium]|nr:hypothetical protein [Sulfurovaceae bacterium]MDD5548863.1 hypothetical protein [Sulfurovaceae bacterium]